LIAIYENVKAFAKPLRIATDIIAQHFALRIFNVLIKVRATPWLIVEAKETDSGYSDQKQQGVARHNTINVYFAQQLPSEWDLISEAVTPLLDGQANEGEKVLPSVKLIQ
jgi:hypothetical protein